MNDVDTGLSRLAETSQEAESGQTGETGLESRKHPGLEDERNWKDLDVLVKAAARL